MEAACGVDGGRPLRELRRLLYCGEWIESHVLHVCMLHAPDFLGYESAIHMAKDHPELVTKSLALKKIGNEIVTLLGGREIHPINVRVGGFYKAPTKAELRPLGEQLEWARDRRSSSLRFAGGLTFPDFEQDYEFVALRHPDEYPLNEGRLVSSRGLDIAVSEYENHFVEEHVAARERAALDGRSRAASTSSGPLARYTLNFDRLRRSAPGGGAARPGLGPVVPEPVQEHRRARRSRRSGHATRRSGSSTRTSRRRALRRGHAARGRRAPASPRPRAASSTTATGSARTASSRRRRSSRRPRRTRSRSRTTCARFVEARFDLPLDELTWQCEQASATTTPASRARRTP